MNKNEFLNKYMPLIGKKITDEMFNTKKLTKTAVLNKYVELYIVPAIATAYKNCKVYEVGNKEITDLLNEVINVAETELRIPSNKAVFYNKNVLTYSLGNSKIGKDTLCISINSSMLCYMGITGNCSNYGICYGCNSNKMYTNEFKKNTLSQIHFIETGTAELINGTIEAIRNDSQITKKQLKNLKYLRISVNGDILNNVQLLKINAIARELIKEFGLISAYSYTHNRDLILSLADSIVFNTSDFYYKGLKSCKTIFEFNPLEYNEETEVLCNGDCNGCIYCKSKNYRNTVLFKAHGNGFPGLDDVNGYILSYLDYNKGNDYLIDLRIRNGF